MKLLQYTVEYNEVPLDTIYIGKKSSLVTINKYQKITIEFEISDPDLNRILFTLHKFDISGIHTVVLYRGKDTWTNYLILKWKDKQIAITFGGGLAIPDPQQRNNLDSINLFMDGLLYKTGLFNLNKK